MSVPTFLRAALAGGIVLLAAACTDRTGPRVGPAAHLALVAGDSARAVAGSDVATPLVVKVTDARGEPVPAASVEFAVSEGNGSVTPVIATSDADGIARTILTLGTTAGTNQVTASVTGVVAVVQFTAVGIPGPAAILDVLTPLVRLHTGIDTAHVSAAVTDQYGNGTTPGPTWTVRDPTLLSVDSTGLLHVLRRGGTTYVVAAAGQRTDSAYVVVLAPGDSPCTGVSTAATLAAGDVNTSFSGGFVCVHAATAGQEYALVPYFNASVPASEMQIEVLGDGLGIVSAPSANLLTARTARPRALAASSTPMPNEAFETMLRRREAALAPLVPAARRWYAGGRPQAPATRSPAGAPMLDVIPSTVHVGDLLTLNASITDCSAPNDRVGRVAAITSKAIVVADTGNPAGGFSDADYASIGTTFDTLVDPLDEQAFGAPTDIDGNSRVVLFFTRAVNALTPKGSNSVVLGFFYARDLLPRTGTDACPTSNQGEMFYLMVPDSAGTVTGQVFSRNFVTVNTIATTAHEFQHLINASRRLYVNHAAVTNEEAWLNEGLSHIAEELLFYRVSGLQPRQDIDSAALVNPAVLQAYRNYHRNNAVRYELYLQTPWSYAPQGADLFDDALQTRGAIWSFLRYAADRLASTDADLWFRLVNSGTSGMANLSQVLGVNPALWMRDWAISNLTDDWVPGIASRYTQPSWNARSYFAAAGIFFPLATSQLPTLTNAVQRTTVLRGGGVEFMRFTVPSGQDALIAVTANGQPLPTTMQLAVVRVR